MTFLHSLQTRLLLGFFVVLVFAALGLLRHLQAVFREQALDRATAFHEVLVDSESLKIGSALNEGRLLALTLSHAAELQKLFVFPGEARLEERARHRLQSFIEQNPGFYGAALFSSDFRMVMDVFSPDLPKSLRADFWAGFFNAGLDPFNAMAKVPVFLDVIYSDGSRLDSRIRYSIPIQDQDNFTMGILIIDQSVRRLLEVMDIATFSNAYFLLDDRGHFLGGHDPMAEWQPDLPQAIANWSPEYLHGMTRSRQGHFIIDSLTGPQLIVYARLLPREQTGLNLTLAQSIPLRRIFGPVNIVNETIAFSISITFVVILLLLLAYSFRILSPVRQLSGLMQRYIPGQPTLLQASLMSRDDEIGALYRSFGVMSRELEAAFEEREQRLRELNEKNVELEQKTIEANKLAQAKSDFLAIMSHEIRTPLNAIMGYSQLLEGEDDIKELQHAKNRILTNSQRLLQLVDNILDFTRMQSGRTRLIEEEFNPYDELESIHESMLPFVTEKAIRFDFEFSGPDDVLLVGDVVRWRQVIYNLVSNAIKFTERGQVCIEVNLQPDLGDAGTAHITVAVADTGDGIPADKMESIFKPFEQLENGLKRRYEGSGLGLAICKNLVELLGGQLTVESQLGKGSRFSFTVFFGVVNVAR